MDEETFRIATSIKGIEQSNPNRYESMIQALKVLFQRPQPSATSMYQQFKERKQLKYELLPLFYLNLIKLAEAAFPDASPADIEKIVAERFMHWLEDEKWILIF